MIALPQQVPAQIDVNALFLTLLPKILRHLQYEFRKLDEERQEEFVQEALANCFLAMRRLVQRGKADQVFPSALAKYAAAQVWSGREVASKLNSKDLTSRYAQSRRQFTLQSLDKYDERRQEWKEAVVNDPKTPVFHQVWFRIDFSAWLESLSTRKRQIALALAKGHTTADVARKFQLTAGRISQLRQAFQDSWRQFHGGEQQNELPQTT